MSVQTASQLISDVNTFLPDNTSEQISASDVRDRLIDMIDSYVNSTDFFTGSSSQYVAGDGSIQPFTNFISDTAYDATSWNGVTTIAPSKNAVRDEFEVINAIIAGLGTTYFATGGNTFGANAEVGTNDAYTLFFQTNNINRGGVDNNAAWMFGLTTPIASTHKSNKSLGNSSASYAEKWTDSGGTEMIWIRNDGLLNSSYGFGIEGYRVLNWSSAAQRWGVGYLALDTASGLNKVGIGQGAGYGSTGSQCLYIGSSANCGLFASGDEQVVIGNSASYISGDYVNFFGTEAGSGDSGNHVTGIGYKAAYNNTRNYLFTVANITDVFWNNTGEHSQQSVTLQAVTQQTAMAVDGTNQSAAASVFKIAQARGTGNAAAGTVVIQKANVQASGTTRHTLTDWWFYDVDGNTGIGGQSYGSGVGVMSIADAGTDASVNPTGGAVLQSKSGRFKVMEIDGSLSWIVKAASSTKTTAAAPYTNDGYVEMIIDGNTYKFMTTA